MPGRRVVFDGIGEVERPLEVTAQQTGRSAPTARAYRYRAGQVIDGAAEDDEMVMVLLSGEVGVAATGIEERVCVRHDPFREPATVLYLPPGTTYRTRVTAHADVLYCRAPGSPGARERSPRLLTSDPPAAELVGGAVSEKLRLREDIVAAGAWATLADRQGPCRIVYHRFASTDGFAVVADDEPVIVRNGDAMVRDRRPYQLAVAPASDLLAVTVTVRSPTT